MSSEEKTNSPNLSDYLTVREAADFLGVSSSTLRNWDRAGKLRAFRHPLNRYRLYKREELQRVLQEIRKEEANGKTK